MGRYQYFVDNPPRISRSDEKEIEKYYNEIKPQAGFTYDGKNGEKIQVLTILIPKKAITYETKWFKGKAFGKPSIIQSGPQKGVPIYPEYHTPHDGRDGCGLHLKVNGEKIKEIVKFSEFAKMIGWKKDDGVAGLAALPFRRGRVVAHQVDAVVGAILVDECLCLGDNGSVDSCVNGLVCSSIGAIHGPVEAGRELGWTGKHSSCGHADQHPN